MTDDSALRRNLGAYAHYQTARSAIAWLPVFFLYMSSVLSVDEALVLESIYYASVVVLEVPSGYASDRLGRRPTLSLAMLAWGGASIVFATTSSFAGFATAQVLMAAGMALNSGTDESLLFDTLAALGEGERFVELEGRAQARARLATAGAALAGGALATLDYRWAYALSAASAAVALGSVARMVEPPRQTRASGPLRQLWTVVRRLANPMLSWLLLFAVVMTVFDHVAYMFVQPWLQLLALPTLSGHAATPLVSGVVTAVTLALAAAASRAAPTVTRRLGPRVALLSAMAGDGVVIAAMALAVHPAIVLVVLLRAMPSALWHPISHGLTHPEIESSIRATYLSVESLAGRLAFSASLAGAAAAVGDLQAPTETALSQLLGAFAAAGGVALVVATATVFMVRSARD